MKPKWKRTLTPDEYSFIINEVSERIRNVIYEKADEQAEETIRQLGGKNVFKHTRAMDNIDITFTITLLVNDLIEILGEHERKNKKK